jgi:hypothetical protein
MPPVCAPTAVYQRRQPTDTVLYRTVEAHLKTFLAHTAGDAERSGLPVFGLYVSHRGLAAATKWGLAASRGAGVP